MFKSFKEAGLKIKARAIPPREIIYGAQHLNLNRRLRSWRITRFARTKKSHCDSMSRS